MERCIQHLLSTRCPDDAILCDLATQITTITMCDDLFDKVMENWFSHWIMPDIDMSDQIDDVKAEEVVVKEDAAVASTWVDGLYRPRGSHLRPCYAYRA